MGKDLLPKGVIFKEIVAGLTVKSDIRREPYPHRGNPSSKHGTERRCNGQLSRQQAKPRRMLFFRIGAVPDLFCLRKQRASAGISLS
ncbi:MAG: hypothetical protein NT163_05935 [Chlorobiales bacterium]|nr:hypothetical protein [Chlorobiales bacterium]